MVYEPKYANDDTYDGDESANRLRSQFNKNAK